jgi:hypothetical protein
VATAATTAASVDAVVAAMTAGATATHLLLHSAPNTGANGGTSDFWFMDSGASWCVVNDQLGTPRGRCDEHSGKFSLSYDTKV